MQETFKLAPHEFTQLRDTISQYELKHEIWTKLNTWNEAQYQWKNEPFNELDVEEMVKEVQQYFKDVHKMAKRLPTDAVVAMFKESVEDFKNAMGVMTDLGNEALAERHWRRIFDKLEQPYFPGQAFKMEANPNPNPNPSPSPSPNPNPHPHPHPRPNPNQVIAGLLMG